MSRKSNIFTADFETTTNPEDCRVWLWGMFDINSEEFIYGTTIEDFFYRIFRLPNKSRLYFHNLKFDGEFIIYHLFRNGFKHVKKIENDLEFSTLITHMNVFYSINIKYNDKEITIFDSLKVIPLPVKKISKAFKIPQEKGEIDYLKEREIGYIPTNREIKYVKNDVEIVGKAMRYFFDQQLDKMTQASNALSDFKKILTSKMFDRIFPNLIEFDAEIRQSYKGGFTYLKPEHREKVIGNGIVFDVNSLYPYVMYEKQMPYGEPIAYKGKYVYDKTYNVYIQMFRCNFELKKGFLPTIQVKKHAMFQNTEYVTTSNGEDVTLCLTNVDLELFLKHYNVYNIEYFNGWKFKSSNRIFKNYIDKWIKIKNNASIDGNKGLRTIAKLMLNALYGKFGLNPNVRSKIPTFDGEYVKYILDEPDTRKPLYIPIASFVTSYAREITITAAQLNYDRFIYADTDSLHLIGLDIPTNINIDSVKLGFWKFEGNFNKAKYLRSKAYIENMFIEPHVFAKLSEEEQDSWSINANTCKYESLNMACAGLPKDVQYTLKFDDFHSKMVVPGKLQHKRVKGGVILKSIDFTIRM